ncbi:kinase-like domain-containing protein [Desarmillaria tabescens]|uniref:Kinase-like domain-containing protein n=1 Tax=Armillaria tabescens TaxID=1929756 RepID=A0AA39MI02_ARMTA|nr:kinase-like domain-containing protein [Desarmillaria tabescens]KAK0434553.1 kinase-like domain-containing protein [Desarmillaria tabescens]
MPSRSAGLAWIRGLTGYAVPTACQLDFTLFGHLFSQIRCMVFLKSIAKFLRSDSNKRPTTWDIEDPFKQDVIEEAINLYCWNVADGSNIVVGVTSDEKVEFLLSDGCYGTLDESFGLKVGDDNVDERDFFFPILPTVAVYILGTITRSSHPRPAEIVLDHESEIDVHLRNAMTLSAVPRMNRSSSSPKLYFSSLPSITRSISSYDEFRCRWIPELFGDIAVTDLTDDVTLIGRACSGGAFSDVWKGKWWDQVEGKERAVAKEKLFKRLHAEVLTWHYLCHRNVSQLYGIMQSETSVGMVSAWCEHGTIRHYLKSVNPKADRMKLMHQIASGVAYLHDFRPTIIHGDLKGATRSCQLLRSSSFAGSMRWMAPEIVRALVEVGSEATMPQVTTASDVYAFGSVCLEVRRDRCLPYAYRKHDPGVMFDIMAG